MSHPELDPVGDHLLAASLLASDFTVAGGKPPPATVKSCEGPQALRSQRKGFANGSSSTPTRDPLQSTRRDLPTLDRVDSI